MYIHICHIISLSLSLYIYIYIDRERERERDTHMYAYIYIYIYIYIVLYSLKSLTPRGYHRARSDARTLEPQLRRTAQPN